MLMLAADEVSVSWKLAGRATLEAMIAANINKVVKILLGLRFESMK